MKKGFSILAIVLIFATLFTSAAFAFDDGVAEADETAANFFVTQLPDQAARSAGSVTRGTIPLGSLVLGTFTAVSLPLIWTNSPDPWNNPTTSNRIGKVSKTNGSGTLDLRFRKKALIDTNWETISGTTLTTAWQFSKSANAGEYYISARCTALNSSPLNISAIMS